MTFTTVFMAGFSYSILVTHSHIMHLIIITLLYLMIYTVVLSLLLLIVQCGKDKQCYRIVPRTKDKTLLCEFINNSKLFINMKNC